MVSELAKPATMQIPANLLQPLLPVPNLGCPNSAHNTVQLIGDNFIKQCGALGDREVGDQLLAPIGICQTEMWKIGTEYLK